MDRQNMSKECHKRPNNRTLRSTSSPSGSQNVKVIGPQRTQSELLVGGSNDLNYYQALPLNIPSNPIGVYNGYVYPQQYGNSNFSFGRSLNSNLFVVDSLMYPVTSSSSFSYEYQGHRAFSTGTTFPERNNILERKWESVNNDKTSNQKFFFTIMSYNVLAQDLIDNHEYLYKNHNKKALHWEVRWVNLLREIGDANPDIICFQEVQESHIEGYFGVLEKKLGYKSLYKKRTGIRTDGCAIYYKEKRLHLIEYEKVEFYQENIPVLNRDNVAIVARFVPKQVHTQAFIVATTHLLYNPKRQDVRLAQIQSLIAQIDKMAFICTNEDGSASYLPIIMTGDLNATPDSAIYEFISRGVLDYENLSRRVLTKDNGMETTGKVLVPQCLQLTDNCQYAEMVEERMKLFKGRTNDSGENLYDTVLNKIIFSSGTLSHPFTFKSAYKHIRNNDYEGTTHQDIWITVDYIFYSGRKRRGKVVDDKLKLLSRYQLLTRKQLNGIRIPNWKLGSDHFSLIVKFSLE